MLIYNAPLRRSDERSVIFFRKLWRNLDSQADLLNHAAGRILLNVLYNTDTVSRKVTLPAEVQAIDSSPSAVGI